MRRNFELLILSCGLCTAIACTTPTPLPPAPTREVLLEREAVAEGVLLRQVEERISDSTRPKPTALRAQKEVEIFLRKIGLNLAGSDPEIGHRPLGVILTRNPEFATRPFGIPGNRIYVPVQLLKSLQTESEWAACIAFELAHLIRHSLAYRWDPIAQHGDLFGLGGLFAFGDRDHRDAVSRAVTLLYRAGYDPRGMASYFEVLRKIPDHKPWSEDTIDLLEDTARRATARLAPLRHPVVRSAGFLSVQTWVKQL